MEVSDNDSDHIDVWESDEYHDSDREPDSSSEEGLGWAWGDGYGDEGNVVEMLDYAWS